MERVKIEPRDNGNKKRDLLGEATVTCFLWVAQGGERVMTVKTEVAKKNSGSRTGPQVRALESLNDFDRELDREETMKHQRGGVNRKRTRSRLEGPGGEQ